MKRKGISAAIMVTVMVFSGCSENAGESYNSGLPVQSVSAVQIASGAPNTPTGSRGGAPTVIAPNFRDTLPDNPSAASNDVPDTSTDVSQSYVPTNGSVHTMDEDFLLESGSAIRVETGESLILDADVTVDPGASIYVEDGAELMIAGIVKLEGSLRLCGEGKLVMLDTDSLIDGNGDVFVETVFSQIDCGNGTIKAHIEPPEPVIRDGATYVGGIVIANKAITLPPEFGEHLSSNEVEPEVYEALQKMNKDAGHTYINVSGYRDYWSQKWIFQKYVDRDGYDEAVTYSAKEGHSEHQTGYTMDLDSLDESYGYTAEGIWLAENCWKYGFIIRYPKGKEDITGYTYEPWHVRYIGRSTAKLVYDSGLTLEEFLNVPGGWDIID